MKLTKRFKTAFYPTLLGLYATGVGTWIYGKWFSIDRGYGLEANPTGITLLHVHSVIGLWFLLTFGYLWHCHIERAWKSRKKRTSGVMLLTPILLLFITVPGLFYLTDEKLKEFTSAVHTYVGLFVALPFFFHFLRAVQARKPKPTNRPTPKHRR